VLNQDYREFVRSLDDNHVRCLVIGGYAVALHGYPRYTKDIDIWIEMSPENAVNMIKALEQFGFGSLGLQVEDFLIPDQVITGSSLDGCACCPTWSVPRSCPVRAT